MNYRELRQALTSKGQAEPDTGKDHVFYYADMGNGLVKVTKISHGSSGQIDDKLLSLMARQMRLTTPELRQFVDCTLDRDKWITSWNERLGIWNR